MSTESAIIMSEPPAPCFFKCPYCYVPKNFDRRNDKKAVCGNDFLRLGAKTGASKLLFWMCGVGEPFMRPDYREVFETLTRRHKTVAVTNLAYFGNDTPEKIARSNPDNFGCYWSIHWNEMNRLHLLSLTLDRVKMLLNLGVKIWPTLIFHPEYFSVMNDVLATVDKLGLKLIVCRYRLGQGDLAKLPEEEKAYREYKNCPTIDWRLWSLTPDCWNVKGGDCAAGIKQVIIDAWWNICTCHGDGNKIRFGSFPEDIDKITLRMAGRCRSSKCPCKHSVFWGVNNKFPLTFDSILADWDEWFA